jgi:hypothetical protein
MSSDSGNSAFASYSNIAGENEGATEIAMTAPVIMDKENNEKTSSGNSHDYACVYE